jgi:transcriptional regulator with XRE-family HTH domain
MEKEVAKKLKTIGANIRKRRIENKLELKDIANKLTLTPQAYGNIENGKTNINFSHIYALSKIFNTSFSEILDSSTHNTTYNTLNSNTHNGNIVAVNNGEMCVQTDKEQLANHAAELKKISSELQAIKQKIKL